MMRRVIMIGKTGQLALALSKRAENFGVDITAYDREACDLSASAAEITAFAKALPECSGIIIAAAYTAVDAAEDDAATALQVNAAAPEIFSKLCVERDIPLVHLSTDYVFNVAANKPIKPDAHTDPINAYGRSKLAGEVAIVTSGARAVILRTSWVFDATGKNFMTTMLRIGRAQDNISVVADQIGRPTYAGHLADACLTALNKLMDDRFYQGGIYHATGAGTAVSWAGFAKAIFKSTKLNRGYDVTITPIAASSYPTRAKRPHYSVLDISAFEAEFGLFMPHWQDGLRQALTD